jgi:hypothetical protein
MTGPLGKWIGKSVIRVDLIDCPRCLFPDSDVVDKILKAPAAAAALRDVASTFQSTGPAIISGSFNKPGQEDRRRR